MSTLKGTLNMLYRMIKEHAGAGDKAHSVADTEHNGFMSSKQSDELDAASGRRTVLPVGADVFTLTPGHYEGVNMINSPNNGLVEIDVSIGAGGRKQIFLCVSSTGQLWSYTWHSTGSVDNFGWMSIPRRKTLWAGSLHSPGQNMTLNDSLSKFDYLNVEFDNGAIGRSVTKILISGGNVESMNQAKSDSYAEISLYEAGVWKKTDTSMTLVTNRKMHLSGTNGLVIDDSGLGAIVKIEGVIE
ncbi:hypothetical protein ACVPPR_07210 [Dellaglioa sp. L3N]